MQRDQKRIELHHGNPSVILIVRGLQPLESEVFLAAPGMNIGDLVCESDTVFLLQLRKCARRCIDMTERVLRQRLTNQLSGPIGMIFRLVWR